MEQIDHPSSPSTSEGVARRTVLKRTALIGGATVWAAPAVQAIAAPAFAMGSPGEVQECNSIYQFKINAGSTTFEGGQAPDCQPDGYNPNGDNFVAADGTIPGGHGKVMVTISGMCATITLPGECQLLDGQAKAGSANGGTLQCEDATPTSTGGATNTYTVCLPSRNISFVAGVICCAHGA